MTRAQALKAEEAPPPLDQASFKLLRRLWRQWIASYWRHMILALVIMAFLAATTGAYPLIIKYSYDTLAAGDMSALYFILAAVVCVTVLKGIISYFQAIVTHRIGLLLKIDLQQRLFAHILQADFAWLTRDPPGHLVSRLTSDVRVVQDAFLAVLTHSVRDILTIIALMASMLYLDWFLSLLVLLVYPLAVIPIIHVGRRIRRNAKRTQSELGGMTSVLIEKLSGVRLLKTFQLENYAESRINGLLKREYKLRMKAIETKARLNPVLEILGGVAVAGIIAFVGYRITSGVNTLGDFTGFIAALLMAAQPVRGLGNLNAKIQEGIAGAERVFEILDEKPKTVDRPGAKPLDITQGSLAFEQVTFAYREGHNAVKDFSLHIPGGRTVALVGRSGAGKSTIMNLVPRLYDPQSGVIKIDDQDIAGVTVASLRESMSIVSQDITLFNDTIRTNIALGKLTAPDDEIIAAAEAAAAHDFITALPEGYDTVIGDRGLRLSGGQRQRVALARAILKDAPILLLDEATSSLDAESERLVQEALASFSRNRTTLVIAHRLSTVQNANLICVMDGGTVVETGTHGELLGRNGSYASFCRSQLLLPPANSKGLGEENFPIHPMSA